MKKFLLKLALFIFPIVGICIPALLHMRSLGELVSLDEAVEKNQREGSLVGFAYSDPGKLLKYRVLERRSPELIALGTSRALQIRSYYFVEPEQFYNCGRSVSSVNDLRVFLDSYPTTDPEVIVLSLDQDFFNRHVDDLPQGLASSQEGQLSVGGRYLKSLKALVKVVRKGRYKNPEFKNPAGVGGLARWYQDGFRTDGSYCYGGIMSAENDYQFKRTLKRVAENDDRFSVADDVNAKAVEQLRLFLQACAERKIHVAAFLPPYAKTVYSVFAKSPESYPHIVHLYEELAPIFANHGMSLFDFGDMEQFGSNDFETIDGFHGSEVCYLRMVKAMSQEDQILAKYVDEAKAHELLKNAYSSRQLRKEVEEDSPHPAAP